MKLKSKFKDLFIIQNKSYKDNRGYFKELIRESIINKKFPFLVMSFSKKNVIRGLHIQTNNSQGKFVSVLKGKILDVAIDLRKNSKTFGKVYKCILSEKNSRSVFIPPGFAHGMQALDNENYIIYSCTKYRDKKSEITIKFDEKDFNIKWQNKKYIISKRDKNGISFSEFKKKYL